MACDPYILTAEDHRPTSSELTGFVSYSTALTTTGGLVQWAPIATEVLVFGGMFDQRKQYAVLERAVIRESASGAGTLKNNDLRVLLFGSSVPTTPVDNTAYVVTSVATYLGAFDVPASSYGRIGAQLSEAVVFPDIPLVSFSTGDVATIWAVVLLSNATPTTYDASASASLALFPRLHAHHS